MFALGFCLESRINLESRDARIYDVYCNVHFSRSTVLENVGGLILARANMVIAIFSTRRNLH